MAKSTSISSRDNLVNSHLTANLCYLIQEHKITSLALAHSIGVSPELIAKLKNGSLCNPSLKVLMGLSKHFKLPLEELIFRDLTKTKYSAGKKQIHYISVRGWDQVRTASGESKLVATELVAAANGVFALQLEHNCGKFPAGAFIFIDSNISARNNDYVLIVNKKTGAAYIRRLIIEDAHYLQSLVADINQLSKYNDREQHIVGVIVAYQFGERQV